MNMLDLKFTNTDRNYLYQIDLENLPDRQSIQQELVTIEWRSLGMPYRQRCFDPKSTALQNITKFMLSDQVKRIVLDKLWEDPELHAAWQITSNDMMDSSSSLVSWVNDEPGWEAGLHLDPRLVIATGWIYFTEFDDPALGTEFYTDDKRSNPLAMKTGFGKGWVLANLNSTWHDGWNRTNHNRYCLSYFILLNTGPKDHAPNRPFEHFKDENSYIKKYWTF